MLTIQVANGTAIEKANRISEVLLAIVRPAPLLFGKVVAVGLIGAMTLLAGAVPVLIKAVAGGDLPAGLLQGLAAGGAVDPRRGALPDVGRCSRRARRTVRRRRAASSLR